MNISSSSAWRSPYRSRCSIRASLGDHGGLGLRLQRANEVELGIERLGTEACAALGELADPLLSVAGLVHAGASGPDGTSAVQRLEPYHHAGPVLDQTAVGPGEFFEICLMTIAVVNGPERATAQLLGDPVGVDLVCLVARTFSPRRSQTTTRSTCGVN